MHEPNEFAIAIRMDREAIGITQLELAEVLNVTQQAVTRWENGLSVPKQATRMKLREYLNNECAKKGTVSKAAEAKLPNPKFLTEDLYKHYEESKIKGNVNDTEAAKAHVKTIVEQTNKFQNAVTDEEELPIYNNDILGLIEGAYLIKSDTYLVSDKFGSEFSPDVVSKWIQETPPNEVVEFIDDLRQKVSDVWGGVSKRHQPDARQERLFNESLRDLELRKYLHPDLLGNLQVTVQRGINHKRYDYFSNNVVAEFRYLHQFRQPTFQISQYAPSVVQLLLAKEMSFGQKKTYFLFLVSPEFSNKEEQGIRAQSLQLDCASLGVHLLLISNVKTAALAINLAEHLSVKTEDIKINS